jgi:ribosomal protein S18 acetylase RimI-like enzyme
MSEHEVRIRPAGADDAERLALVGQATFLETYATTVDGEDILAHCAGAHSAAAYREHLARPGVRAWLAETAGRGAPVGYLLLTPAELEGARPGDLEVRRVYVLHAFQGRRIGLRLLEEATAASRAAGAPRLLLSVYSANAGALAFYARTGFRKVGTRTFVAGNGRYDDFVLAREL